MLLRQMKYFAAVVDCSSFTEAAERCYISQSAISQQIQALEKELGVELLHRENRRFSLTPAGEYFYTHSKGVLEEIEDLRRETAALGRGQEPRLRIGYLRSYSGEDLHQAIAAFSRVYPEVPIHLVTGTHEELYDQLRFGGVDVILSDQRRAFSDEYFNEQLVRCGCYAELSTRSRFSGQDSVTLEDLRHTPCVLIAPKEQQAVERDYYENTLGFRGSFLFAENLEEGRLLVVADRGFLPIESVGTLPSPGAAIRRLPVYRNGKQLTRNYCAFWLKERTNDYIEAFGSLLKKLLQP